MGQLDRAFGKLALGPILPGILAIGIAGDGQVQHLLEQNRTVTFPVKDQGETVQTQTAFGSVQCFLRRLSGNSKATDSADSGIIHLRLVLGSEPPQLPRIITQPQSQAASAGGSATFTVAADAVQSLTYQWTLNGGSLPGETGSSLALTNLRPDQAGVYVVLVGSSAGVVASRDAQLTFSTLLCGQVTDALTGERLPGVVVSVSGFTTTTDSDGAYCLAGIPTGTLAADFDADVRSGPPPLVVHFTNHVALASVKLDATKAGYLPYSNNQVPSVTGQRATLDFSMSPALAPVSMRIVLTWGENPVDLDAHLKTPVIDGTPHHIFFLAALGYRRGSTDVSPNARLDLDDRTGFGPETVTITRFVKGTYHYFVHDFTQSDSLKQSGAVVSIYGEGGLLQTIKVPTSGSGNYWHICSIDRGTRRISVINKILDTMPPLKADLPPIVISTAGTQAIQPGSTSNPQTTSPGKVQLQSPGATGYVWNFGDGSFSTLENPTHTYTTCGCYNVSLTVTGSSNDSDTEAKVCFINVNCPPNTSPTISGIADIAVEEGTRLRFTTSATDNDLPTQT